MPRQCLPAHRKVELLKNIYLLESIKETTSMAFYRLQNGEITVELLPHCPSRWATREKCAESASTGGKEKVFSSRLGAAVGHLISRMSLHVPVKEEIE